MKLWQQSQCKRGKSGSKMWDQESWWIGLTFEIDSSRSASVDWYMPHNRENWIATKYLAKDSTILASWCTVGSRRGPSIEVCWRLLSVSSLVYVSARRVQRIAVHLQPFTRDRRQQSKKDGKIQRWYFSSTDSDPRFAVVNQFLKRCRSILWRVEGN